MITNKINLKEIFLNGALGHKMPHFPYPERSCPFCERPVTIVEAVHIQEHPENFKVLFICFNPECGAYDEAAGQAYARVYYSSVEAYRLLEQVRIIASELPTKDTRDYLYDR